MRKMLAATTRTLRGYWPLLLIPFSVAVIHYALISVNGNSFSPEDWAGDIVFACAITIATILLGRQQGKLQKSLAASKLVESTAGIYGLLSSFHLQTSPKIAAQIIISARSGLHLLPRAEVRPQAEYFKSLRSALSSINNSIELSTTPYSQWKREDWKNLEALFSDLLQDINGLPKRVKRAAAEELDDAVKILEKMSERRFPEGTIPFDNFEHNFRSGANGKIVRSLLNWDLLRTLHGIGEAEVSVHTEVSITWLRSREVFSVWYKDRKSNFTEYHSEGARPVKFNEIDRIYRTLPPESQASIASMALNFEVQRIGSLPSTEVVTLSLPHGRTLVLDGNHRLASMVLNRGRRPVPIPVNIIEYRISAPLVGDLLPDLEHHIQKAPKSTKSVREASHQNSDVLRFVMRACRWGQRNST